MKRLLTFVGMMIVPTLVLAHGSPPEKLLYGAAAQAIADAGERGDVFLGVEATLDGESKIKVSVFREYKSAGYNCKEIDVEGGHEIVCTPRSSSPQLTRGSIKAAFETVSVEGVRGVKAWPDGEDVQVRVFYTDGSTAKLKCHSHGAVECHVE